MNSSSDGTAFKAFVKDNYIKNVGRPITIYHMYYTVLIILFNYLLFIIIHLIYVVVC